MASTAPLIQCRICGQLTPASSGSQAPPDRCNRCGTPFSTAFSLDTAVPAAPAPAPAATLPRPTPFTQTVRALGIALLWGLGGGIAAGTVLAVVFAGIAAGFMQNAMSSALFGLDIGFLAGGFSVSTWKAVRELDLEALGGAAVGAAFGLCTAALHLVLERTLLNMSEPTAHIAVPIGLVAGMVLGGCIGYWNEE